ncbi:MAG: helix-turn-helix domain-containing protein [Roseobacter sp.]|jgi:AraC-like DNA-binding protein
MSASGHFVHGPGGHWQRHANTFRTDREYVRGVPLRELETIYLGRQQNAGRNAGWVIGRDVALVRYNVIGESTTNVVPDPEWGVVMFPLWWEEPPRLNGAELKANDVFCWNREGVYTGLGKTRETLTLGYRKARMCKVLSHMAATEIEPDALFSRVIAVDTGTRNRLTGNLLRRMEEAFAHALRPGLCALPDHLEALIIEDIAQYLYQDPAREAVVRPALSQSLRVVDKALDAFRNNAATATISDLCAASGVGVTTLHRAFCEVHGVSPAQFLLKKRLSAARELLLWPDLNPRSVKNVALSLGFEGSGRFAQYYKRAFGELPGETLLRNSNPR